jgi:hypothetical protein
MSTSGAVATSTYGFTLYQYPVSGTFAADRAPIIGNTSSAAAQIGSEFAGIVTPPTPQNYTTNPTILDGVDYTRTVYRSTVVTVPVVIYETTATAALIEWRRIVGAFEARYQRAALAVTDPAASGQATRWLTELVYRGSTDVPVVHDTQQWFLARLQFETVGTPFWTPEPGVGEVSITETITTSGAVEQFALTNPGDQGTWPTITVASLAADATVTLTLAETGETVTIVDVGTGNTGVDFDRRKRSASDDGRVSAASVFYRIPPGSSRVDVVVTGAVTGSSTVTVSYLPQYSTV